MGFYGLERGDAVMTFYELTWDSPEEKELFVAELGDLLQTLEDSWLSGEPDIAAAFRAAHTIKGSAAMVGLDDWSSRAHNLEDRLDQIRKNPDDQLEESLRLDVLNFVDFIRQELNGRVNSEANAESSPQHWRITLSPACALKGARAFQILQRVGELARIVSSRPSGEDIQEFERFDGNTVDVSFEPIGDQPPVDWPEIFRSIPEVEEWEQMESMEEDPKSRGTTAAQAQQRENMIRIHPQVLEGLLDGLGELLMRHAELSHRLNETSPAVKEALDGVKQIAMNLQDMTLRARMLPLSTLFHQYPRAVHDIARKLSKDITLSVEGGETQLDRLVMDRLHEPLLHLIRNAADHGIETASERLRKGKPLAGHIFLQASSRKGRVRIVVADDGRGIDWNGLRNKAVARDVMTADQARNATSESLVAMLFLPGFSTKDQVSDLSGRGVGLDVVKDTVDQLHGDIRVESEPGRGTRFIMELPMTMAILSALLIAIGPVVLGIPVLNVERIEPWHQDDVKHTLGVDMIDDHGHPLKVTVLSQLLKIEGSDPQMVIRVQDGAVKMAFVVDTVLGQQDVVIKPLGRVMPLIPWMTGAALLGDGRVALMMDVKRLAEKVGHNDSTALPEPVAAENTRQVPGSSWLVFGVGPLCYGISVDKVQEVLLQGPVNRIVGQHPLVEGVTMIREESYPVLSGKKLMDAGDLDDGGYFIVVHMSQHRFVLSVDIVKEIVPIAWSQIQPVPHHDGLEVIMGLAEVGGMVIQLVDFDAVLSEILPNESVAGEQKDHLPSLRGVQVFLADDSRLARQKLTAALINQGAEVTAYEEGQALMTGLAQAQNLPHVVVTDVEMPKMDGYHLLEQVKAEFPGISVIVHTSLDGRLSKEHCIELGADFVLTKWDVGELVRRVGLASHQGMDNKGGRTHALIAD